MNSDAMIFSTKNSRYFAELIASQLGLTVGEVERDEFGDGEQYYCFDIDEWDTLMGKTVIIVGSTHTDADLLEVYRLGCAAADYGTEQRIFVIPFLGYSTMERAVKPGEVVTAKTNARMLSSIPNSRRGNVFLLLDLHATGMLHYFEGECLRYEMYAGPSIVKALSSLPGKYQFGSADLGRPAWVKYFAKELSDGSIVVVDKDRNFAITKVMNVIGDVQGRDVIIYDDMSRSFGTLCDAANAYLDRGAKSVGAVLSHLAIYGDTIVKKIEDSPLSFVLVTNSHPMSQLLSVQTSQKIKLVDVSAVFSRTIKKLV